MGKHIARSGVPVDTAAVNCGLPGGRKTDRDCAGDNVRVAQQDRAQDSLLQNWALRRETSQRIRSKSGKAGVPLGTLPIPSQATPAGRPARNGRCRDWTGGTCRLRPMVKGQSRPRTPEGGGESRSGMNPGAVGSNPAADTISNSSKIFTSRPSAPDGHLYIRIFSY